MTKNLNWRQVIRIQGQLLLTEAAFLLVASIVALVMHGDDFLSLMRSAVITAIVGASTLLIRRRDRIQMGIRESYFVVGTIWIIFSIFGMMPFYFSGYIPTVTDAFFETISGFTTTGATILPDIESLPHGLLFWRSLIQWIGGMGIIVLSLAILPMISSGSSMHLYAAEVPGVSYDKIQPRMRETAQRLWAIYLILTLVQAILLKVAGMGYFDAVCHALTTMSSGGNSTKQASIAYWNAPSIHYIIMVFMLLSGVNFTLLYHAIVKRNYKKLFSDEEFRTYLMIILVITLFVAGWLIASNITTDMPIELQIRQALFQTIAVITTTGYTTVDYMTWPTILWFILFFVMLFGASAGSTSGGIKVIRIVIMIKNLFCEFRRIMHPKAIIPVRINHRVVPERTVFTVYTFITIYIILTILSTGVLIITGLNPGEAFSVTISSITNVGLGIGAQGPSGSFATLPDFAKWYLSLLMVIGRLELFTILILFSPSFWRR